MAFFFKKTYAHSDMIFHNFLFFIIKTSSDIKMGIGFLEKNCHRLSEIYLSFLLSKPNYFIQFAMGYPVR